MVDKRYPGLCPSYVSTWGIDGQHFTQYTTSVPCAGTSAWTSIASDTPATTGSAHAAQDAGFQLSHAKSLGVVIGLSIGASALIGLACWGGLIWGKRVQRKVKDGITEAERNRLKEEYLEQGRQERQATIDGLEQRIRDLERQPNQAQEPAGGAVNPPRILPG